MMGDDQLRTGLGVDVLARAVEDHLLYLTGRRPQSASVNDVYLAVAHAVRDRMFALGASTLDASAARSPGKQVAYLSAEFLIGPQLGANLLNLGIVVQMRDALQRLGFNLYTLLDHEEEPGLGNGGPGRLAACYLDSLATLAIPAIGYGIRYEFGIFDQEIRDGWQVEVTDKWLHWGNPWEIARPELAVTVGFGGHTEMIHAADGSYHVRWTPGEAVRGFPTTFRSWVTGRRTATRFDCGEPKPSSRSTSRRSIKATTSVPLMPNPRELPDHWAVQLNDTHPAIAVAELMRLLVDDRGLGWDEAWDLTVRMTSYTNHTLLPEALETWPIELFARTLPRHLEIIYEINDRLLVDVRRRFPGDASLVARVSLIDEGGGRSVRMANLACAGSHAINGVARLHTTLLMQTVLRTGSRFIPSGSPASPTVSRLAVSSR